MWSVPIRSATAQDTGDNPAPDSIRLLVTTRSDWAWRPVIHQDSVRVDYIFYAPDGDVDNGVVLKITNDRSATVDYRFTLILTSGDRRQETEVVGRVGPKSLVTGDSEGLYFSPFGPEAAIGEIGLRGYSFRSEGSQ